MNSANYLAGLKEMIQRHPQDVADLFLDYGIRAEVTPSTLLDASLAYDDEGFNDKLFALQSSGFDGDSPEKKQKFREFMQKAAVVLGGVGAGADYVKAQQAGADPNSGNNNPAPDEHKRILGMDETLFYVLAATLVLLLCVKFFR